MARQYGNKRSTPQRSSASHQVLVIIVTFLLGYLTASVFDVGSISSWMNTQVLAHKQVKQKPIKAEKQQAQLPPKPKFEFYTLLANEKTTGVAAQSNANNRRDRPSASAAQITSSAAVTTAAVHPVIKQPVNLQQKGLAKVAEAEPIPQPQESKGIFLVQVASFKVRQDAEHMKGMLILKGFNVKVVPVQARGIWFRVVVGPYSNRALAQKAQETLARNERLRGMVTSAG
ncbi:cell division protein FtsN [Legionella antarctica]|uniref:Cell division protein FtsN n=1 Tax=Legionella antarctica TaxID=2708020 RepID=A0A6F8T7F0_9GAMM|nr:SPOR domain-containing protein [Legionella antarctica]BCA96338.1 cell division protein FtsN [Legionella antarctica]